MRGVHRAPLSYGTALALSTCGTWARASVPEPAWDAAKEAVFPVSGPVRFAEGANLSMLGKHARRGGGGGPPPGGPAGTVSSGSPNVTVTVASVLVQ